MATLSIARTSNDSGPTTNGASKRRHEKAILLLESRHAVSDGKGGLLSPPLMTVGERILVRHHLDQLARFGIHDVVAITGRSSEDMLGAIAGRARVLHDARWPVTDAIDALALVEQWVDGPVLILDGSSILEDRLLMRLLDAPGNAVAWDGADSLDDQTVLAARIEPRLVFQMLEMASSNSDAARPYRRLQAALRARASVGLVDLVDVRDLMWSRVDDRPSLRRARRVVWPRLVARPLPAQQLGAIA